MVVINNAKIDNIDMYLLADDDDMSGLPTGFALRSYKVNSVNNFVGVDFDGNNVANWIDNGLIENTSVNGLSIGKVNFENHFEDDTDNYRLVFGVSQATVVLDFLNGVKDRSLKNLGLLEKVIAMERSVIANDCISLFEEFMHRKNSFELMVGVAELEKRNNQESTHFVAYNIYTNQSIGIVSDVPSSVLYVQGILKKYSFKEDLEISDVYDCSPIFDTEARKIIDENYTIRLN